MTRGALNKGVSAGFTLAELLVGLSIATLLLMLALPQWTVWLAEQRVLAASNQLLSALALARGAAIDGGVPVRFCAAAPGGCSTQREWSGGWRSQSSRGAAWHTLRDSGPAPDGVRIEAAATALQEGVVFESRGFAVQAAGGFASGSWVVCARGARQRTVTLAPSGRARLSTGAVCS